MGVFLFGKIKPVFSWLYYSFFGDPFIGTFLRQRLFKKKLPVGKFQDIIDIGCGSGEYSFFLAKKFPSSKVFGIDLSRESISVCNAKKKQAGIKNIDFLCKDFFGLREKEKFGLAISIEVLHLVDKKKAVKKIAALLSPAGTAVLTVPAKNWFNLWFFKSSAAKKKVIEHSMFAETGLLSEKEIKSLFLSNGFGSVETMRAFGFFGNLAWETEFFLLHSRLQRFYYLFFPFLKAIAFFDVFFASSNGRLLLIIAKKK